MIARLKPGWLSALLLLLAVLVLFWPALLHPAHILFPTFSELSDLMIIHWPKARLMAQSWQVGEGLPLWTPLILSGMPLAANQLAMLFYPPAWLFLTLPSEPVFNLLFVFHLLLGGFGVYVLLHRAHVLSAGAALIGGLTFALNGKWLAHAAGGHVSLVGAIGWMPWALFGLMMLLRGKSGITPGLGDQPSPRQKEQGGLTSSIAVNWGWIVLVAAALAMQIVTHTLLLIYTGYLLAAVAGWHLFVEAAHRNKSQTGFVQTDGWLVTIRAELKRLSLPLIIIPALAALLGMVQLLPLLELTEFSNRALSLDEAAEFAVSPVQLLVGLLLPSAQGGHETVIYLGLVPLLLAPFGLHRPNRWTWFYGGLLIFTILFALGPGTPIHSLFYHLAPGFSWVRTPARMLFVGALAVAALVGFGIDRLAQHPWPDTAQRWLTRLTVGLGALTLMTGLGLALAFHQVNRATLGLAVFIPIGLILILLQVRRHLSASVATAFLGLLLFFDLASFDMTMMRFVALTEALQPGDLAAEYLAEATALNNTQTPALYRVYSPSYSLPVQTAAANGLYLADGVEPVHLAVYDQFMAQAGGYGETGFSVTIPNFSSGPLESALQTTRPNLRLLGLLNVVYLASAFPMDWPGLTLETQIDSTYIYRNTYALPKAWIAYRTMPIEANWLAQLERLPDLAGSVLLEPQAEGVEVVESNGAQPDSLVRIRSYSANRIELETELATPGWLILSEIWYPGWQAMVNGSPRPVERVDGLLRGLYLSQPGPYQITLVYRPRSVSFGGGVSGLTTGLLIIMSLFLASKTQPNWSPSG
ncbi:MAG TPA: hypothetical protein VGD99_12500 [Anaerolineae bacterium]